VTWNIGAANGTTNYNGSNGTNSVVATLNSEGLLAVTGTGNTVVFDTGAIAQKAPWTTDTYKDQITTSTIASAVTPTNMEYWYDGCAKLTGAPTIPSSVKDMTATFEECSALTTAPTIPSSVKDMTATFAECSALTTAPTIPDGVTDMYNTFNGCTSLTTAPTIPDGVTDMSSTFNGCTSLTTAPTIPNRVTDMAQTFFGCTSLTTAPTIPNSVTNMAQTFYDCTALTGTMQINATVNNEHCSFCLENASTNPGTNLTVYGSTSANNEEAVKGIVDTKSTTSHISYGGLK